MASPGQKRGLCRHVMVGFDSHLYCARCRDEGKGEDPSVCRFCDILTQDQKACLSTPSYQEKRKKHELKAIQEESSSTLVEVVQKSRVAGKQKTRR